MAGRLIRDWRRVTVPAALLTVGVIVQAAPGWQAQPGKTVAPEAERVLERVRAHYADLKNISVVATMTMSMGIDGVEEMGTHSVTVTASRPNRVALRYVDEGEIGYWMVCDGESLWQYIGPPMNQYATGPAPASYSGIIEAALFGMPMGIESMAGAPHMLLLALLDEDGFNELCDEVGTITHVAREEADGRAYDRIRLSSSNIDLDLWVRAEGEAWVDRAKPDMTRMFAEFAQQMGGDDADLLAQMPRFEHAYTDWNARPDLGREAFAFDPPEGAEEVGSLLDAFANDDGWDEDASHDHLLGRPAPELGLDLLDGGKAMLEAHRGKDVVILDFWASWCPPCVRGMPVISGVAADYADRGVVLYAVNVGESREVAQHFLERTGLDVKVAMDIDGEASERYAVSGIPQLVLIGRDGTVQSVQVGFMPGKEKELAEQLETLLAGKPLATPPEAPRDPERDPEGSD